MSIRAKSNNWYLYQLIPVETVKTFFLNKTTTVIGRIIGADIHLSNDYISRLHCSISIQNEIPVLHNHSQLSIWINEYEVKQHLSINLENHDLLIIPLQTFHPGFVFQLNDITATPMTSEIIEDDENSPILFQIDPFMGYYPIEPTYSPFYSTNDRDDHI